MAGQKQDDQQRTYIQQLCEDTGCCPEDLPEAMNDREKWRERVRDIRATSTTWWWWWWWWFLMWQAEGLSSRKESRTCLLSRKKKHELEFDSPLHKGQVKSRVVFTVFHSSLSVQHPYADNATHFPLTARDTSIGSRRYSVILIVLTTLYFSIIVIFELRHKFEAIISIFINCVNLGWIH